MSEYISKTVNTYNDLPLLSIDNKGEGYLVNDTLKIFIWDGICWNEFAQIAIDFRTHSKIGYFASPSIVGNFSVIGLGFKPKSIHFVGHKNDGMNTWFMQSNGFADDCLNQNVSSFCGNYSNTFKGDAKQDRCIYLFNASGAIQVMATLVSMDIDGFTLNFTNVNSIFGIRWNAIG